MDVNNFSLSYKQMGLVATVELSDVRFFLSQNKFSVYFIYKKNNYRLETIQQHGKDSYQKDL